MDRRGQARFTLIDGLRGLASLAVALHTLLAATDAASSSSWLALSALGAPALFVISGFVIAFALKDVTVNRPVAVNLLLRRAVRLDLPYWIVLVLVLALRFAVSPVEVPPWRHVLMNLLYLQGVAAVPALLETAWILSVELQFFLMFLAVAALAHWQERRLGRGFMHAVVIALLAGMVWWHPPASTQHLLPWLDAFLVGVLTWWTLEGRVHQVWWWATLAMLGVGGVLRMELRPLVVVAVAGLIFGATYVKRVDRWLGGAAAQGLGRMSYALMLVHPVVGVQVLKLGLSMSGDRPGTIAVWIAVAVGSSMLVAHVLHLWVERPCLAWSRRVGAAAPAPVPAPLPQPV